MNKFPNTSAYVAHDTNNLLEHRPKSLHLVNGDSSEAPPPYIHATGDTEGRKKSVTFASNSPSPSTNSFTSQQSPTSSRAIPIPGNIKQNINIQISYSWNNTKRKPNISYEDNGDCNMIAIFVLTKINERFRLLVRTKGYELDLAWFFLCSCCALLFRKEKVKPCHISWAYPAKCSNHMLQ